MDRQLALVGRTLFGAHGRAASHNTGSWEFGNESFGEVVTVGPMDFTVYSTVPGHVPIIRGVTVPDIGGWGILVWPVRVEPVPF